MYEASGTLTVQSLQRGAEWYFRCVFLVCAHSLHGVTAPIVSDVFDVCSRPGLYVIDFVL